MFKPRDFYLTQCAKFLTLVITALTFNVNAQGKLLKQADALFNEKRYGEAYSEYFKISQKKKNKDVSLKMADCNYNIENYPLAQKYYSEYFTDTLYHPTQQYANYANATRLSGKLDLAYKLYSKINQNGGDDYSRSFLESCRLYLDSANKIRVYNLDSVYTCVELDATESHDSLAAPMTYVWDFKDGTFGEGVRVSHCFKSAGENKVTLSIRDKATGYVRVNDTAVVVFIESPPVLFDCPKRPRQYIYFSLDASKLNIENYEILEYVWDLGDGVTALGKKVNRKFDKLDTYTVRLTVIARDKITGRRVLMASSRTVEAVDNYSDHSQTFKDTLNGEK